MSSAGPRQPQADEAPTQQQVTGWLGGGIVLIHGIPNDRNARIALTRSGCDINVLEHVQTDEGSNAENILVRRGRRRRNGRQERATPGKSDLPAVRSFGDGGRRASRRERGFEQVNAGASQQQAP